MRYNFPEDSKMKISEILKQNKRTISYEVFPPKTDSSFESVRAATEEIASLSPAFMSVTYGAGGGTSQYTLEIAKNIESCYKIPTLAHLTCVSSTKETVRRRIADLSAAGIQNIMALRGDIPKESENMPRDYRYAVELVREIRGTGMDFCIGGACYPEIHPESISREDDLNHLREKAYAGLDFLTTQMFFDNRLYYKFLENAEKHGIFLPIIPGVMPITSVNQVERAVSLSNSYMPKEFLALVEKFGSDPVAMKQAGIEYAIGQMNDLYENGVKNIHVYTMNKPDVAEYILRSLSSNLG